ncbi:MAG: glycosyltransferase family 2 protein [Aureispira sp.]|nr:glycosyltransferase family 2 protein [Aureispira sp.]
MNSTALVSIIIVNYNTSKEIEQLLHSLEKDEYQNKEIIIVDNASPNDNVEWLVQKFNYIKIIESDKNLGFAGGNNLGIDKASGEFLLFLNPDVEIVPNLIEPLVISFKKYNHIGLVSPKIKYYNTPDILQYAGCNKMHPITLRTTSIGKKQKNSSFHQTPKLTYYGHGAAMMVPKKVVQVVGKMNERYFLYYEELDWCHRIQKHGYQILYLAEATILHKESVATQKSSPLKTYYLTRNRLLYARLHFSTWANLLSWFYIALFTTPKHIIQNIFYPAHIKAYFKALIWNIRNFNLNQH